MPSPQNKRAKFEDCSKQVLDYINSLGREFVILSFGFTGTSISIRYLEVGTDLELVILELDDRTAVANFISELVNYDGNK